MAEYRCYFLTPEGKIFRAEDVTAETDDHALEKVRRRFAEWEPVPAFELWSGTRLIFSETRRQRTARQPDMIARYGP
jgi:hypothetical protein